MILFQREFEETKERLKRIKETARRLLEVAKRATDTASDEELSEDMKNVSI